MVRSKMHSNIQKMVLLCITGKHVGLSMFILLMFAWRSTESYVGSRDSNCFWAEWGTQSRMSPLNEYLFMLVWCLCHLNVSPGNNIRGWLIKGSFLFWQSRVVLVPKYSQGHGGQDGWSPSVSVNQEAKDDVTILILPETPTIDSSSFPAAWSKQPWDHVASTSR